MRIRKNNNIKRICSTISREVFFEMISFDLKEFVQHSLIVLYS